jgi:hypothetical protein
VPNLTQRQTCVHPGCCSGVNFWQVAPAVGFWAVLAFADNSTLAARTASTVLPLAFLPISSDKRLAAGFAADTVRYVRHIIGNWRY